MHINKINSKSKRQRLKTITVMASNGNGCKMRVLRKKCSPAERLNQSKNQVGQSSELFANAIFCLVILIATLVASNRVDSSRLPELKQQIRAGGALKFTLRDSRQLNQQDQNGFQLHDLYSMGLEEQRQAGASQAQGQSLPSSPSPVSSSSLSPGSATTRNLFESSSTSPMSLFNLADQIRQTSAGPTNQRPGTSGNSFECSNGLLTFELATGFIYKPSGSDETLSMMPTLQLTDCLEFCLQNASCLAINFEMGLCVLLANSAKQNQQNLFASQFPVFTIYAEKKCLLTDPEQTKQRRRCQRAWTFERVAGYEMKTKPRRRLKLANKELCMEACLVEREFACRSANWHRQTGECSLHDQDRHSVSQSEAGDQRIKASLLSFYGPQSNNLTAPIGERPQTLSYQQRQNYFNPALIDRSRLIGQSELHSKLANATSNSPSANTQTHKQAQISSIFKQLFYRVPPAGRSGRESQMKADWPISMQQHYVDLPVDIQVDYLENNCIYEPNKLCEFRKIQNRVLKTVDSIYQDVATLEECRQKCLNAPYRCYSFDYGDTSERVCRTSHLDQASLMSVNEPYLEVAGAITYELAACFNVTIQCRARAMVAQVSSSKSFNGKIYAKSRPASCMTDVSNSLQFELEMKYHDDACDVRATSNQHQGVFSNDIIIQHHDSIVTTQDVGLSVYCQYDLGNRSVTNNVDLAIERLPDGPMESKQQQQQQQPNGVAGGVSGPHSSSGPLTITSLATTVVKSPNVTMRITNMNGQPVASATVGDRLALLFEIKEKTSPFGILVREIVAMDGRQLELVNNSSQHLNSSHLYQQQYAAAAELQAQQPANSIQFLDHEGCPTDARLMGPLVRMDPQGHRLLAPFDAFKFPASEMVFFRAVVSSCVSECKPAMCSGGDLSGSLGPAELAPHSYGDLYSATPPDDVVATTRNMPTSSTTTTTTTTTSGSTTYQQPLVSTIATEKPLASSTLGTAISAVATSTMGTEAPSREQQTSFASTLAPYESGRTTKLHSQQTDLISNLSDLLTSAPSTNVAQFATSRQPADMAQSPTAAAMSSALVDLNALQTNDNATNNSSGQAQDQSFERISMTNNHNLGRPSPRPMTTTTIMNDENNDDNYTADALANYQQETATSGQVGQPILPPKLVLLTSDEHKAIENLIKGYLSSTQIFSSSALPESTMRSSLPRERADEKILLNGLVKLFPMVEFHKEGNVSSNELTPAGTNFSSDVNQQQTLLKVLRKMKLLSESNEPSWAFGDLRRGDASLESVLKHVLLAVKLLDVLNIERVFDTARASVRREPDFDANEEFASERISFENLDKQIRGNLTSPQSRLNPETGSQSRNFPAWLMRDYYLEPIEGITFAQAASKIVPLVSEPFARLKLPEKLFGSRDSRHFPLIWRSKREVVDDELSGSSSYVYMSQKQPTTNFSQPNELKFTNGHVEMYRIDQLHRIRRQAPLFEEFEAHQRPRDQHHEQPKYELEEMVVQSIKIVDRIHFEDEQLRKQQSRDQRDASRRRSPLRKLARQDGASPQANRQLKDEGSLIEVDNYNQEPLKPRLSAINILLVAMCFIFMQISMVLLCLINWNRQRRGQRRNRSLFPDLASFKTVDSSTISSSMAYSDCSNYR